MSKIKDLNEMENLKLNIIWATSKEKNCKFYKYYFYSFKIVVTSPKQQQKIDVKNGLYCLKQSKHSVCGTFKNAHL